jgi:hypothetical protein
VEFPSRLWPRPYPQTLNQVSISPIFYEQLFGMKVFCVAFMCLLFGFVIFWQKDFGAKAAHKMLMKLTPGRKSLTETNITFKFIRNFSKLRLL